MMGEEPARALSQGRRKERFDITSGINLARLQSVKGALIQVSYPVRLGAT
jgi:hypothetical protein